MSTPNTPRTDGSRRRALGTALTSGLALLVLGGCGMPGLSDSGDDPAPSDSPTFVEKAPPKPSKQRKKKLGPDAKIPERPEIDEHDATQVAKAWGVVAYGYDTKYDDDPHDATLRALGYLTEKRARIEREYRPAAGAGADWNTWARHKAWTKPTAKLQVDADNPKDTARRAYRRVAVSATARGRDGWKGTGPRVQAYVTLQRSAKGKPWRIGKVVAIPAAKVPEPTASTKPKGPTDPTDPTASGSPR